MRVYSITGKFYKSLKHISFLKSLQSLVLNLPQVETVAGYLNSSVKLPDSKYYNSSNRAYPDVSAMSDDFWIIINRFVIDCRSDKMKIIS